VGPRIIFEDQDVCVIDKPAGMVVNRSQTSTSDTVQQWHWARLGEPAGQGEFYDKQGVVHRLDKDTSGVMVLAKTPGAYEGLKQQFLERKTKKTYLALVHGEMGEEQGIISAPIDRHPKDRMKFTVGGNKAAITEWRVVRRYLHPRGVPQAQHHPGGGLTLLSVEPHTGRTHQIRVHMKHLGHPIVSDPIYGGRKIHREDIKWCRRLFLHAKSLEFVHPGTGEKRLFESELPDELVRVVKKLGRE